MDNNQPQHVVQQPTRSVGVEPEPVPAAGCCCLPASASCPVVGTRVTSIVIIIICAVRFLLEIPTSGLHVFNVRLWIDFVTLAVAIFAGCRLYCSLSKASHTLAAVLYAVGFVAGVIQAGYWLYELLTFRHDRRDDDDEYTHTIELREGLRIVFFNMVPDAIGSVAFLVGSVFASKASRDWRDVEICKNTDEGGSSREALPV